MLELVSGATLHYNTTLVPLPCLFASISILYPKSSLTAPFFLFMHSLLSGMIQAAATTHGVSKKNQVISESAIFHRQALTGNTGRNGRPAHSHSLSLKVKDEISPVCAFYSDSSGEGPILNTNESHLVCFHDCF